MQLETMFVLDANLGEVLLGLVYFVLKYFLFILVFRSTEFISLNNKVSQFLFPLYITILKTIELFYKVSVFGNKTIDFSLAMTIDLLLETGEN